MEVVTPKGEMNLPIGEVSIQELVSKLQSLFGNETGITERTKTFINGEQVEDMNFIIEEGSSVVFQNNAVKVIKAVGNVAEVSIEPVENETVSQVIERALATVGQTIVFSDNIQVLDYSQTPQIIYTNSQLNETVRDNAILKIIPFGKDTSGC